MLNLNTYEDVYKLALIIGKAGIDNAMKSIHTRPSDREMIRGFINFSNETIINVKSFNDGNNIFEVDLHLNTETEFASCAVVKGKIVRHGFGAGTYEVADYFRDDLEGFKEILDHVETSFKYRKALEA